ncbi:MAG: hypothetical protein WEB30_09390 [Cyclobacteriaceae bacterium]
MTLIRDNIVPFLELKRLLYELQDLRPDISFRYRLMGEMWQPNFLRIMQINEKGAVLIEETSKKLVIIQNLSNVMQFELDHPFRQYEAHNHYTVEATLVH